MRSSTLLLFFGGIAFLCTACQKSATVPGSVPAPSPTPSIQANPVTGWVNVDLAYGGLPRHYRVYIPPGFSVSNLNIVVGLHGGGGNKKTIEELGGLSAKADSLGYLLVFPEGSGPVYGGNVVGTWNAGNCCGSAVTDNVDDVGFIRTVIAQLKAKYGLAANVKVFVTGHSNGAMMSYRLACEAADLITAIAPVGGVEGLAVCNPSRPVPTLHLHGTEDPCNPYLGGQTGTCFSTFFKNAYGINIPQPSVAIISVPNLFNTVWSPLMQATGGTAIVHSSGAATCYEKIGSNSRSVVQFCPIVGMGHVWPGGKYGGPCTTDPASNVCKVWKTTIRGPADGIVTPAGDSSDVGSEPNADLNGTDYIFQFFSRFK